MQAFFSHKAVISTSLLCFCRDTSKGNIVTTVKNWTFSHCYYMCNCAIVCETRQSLTILCDNLPNSRKPELLGALRRYRIEVTFRAAFIAVTVALHSDRAWVWSPLQSAWRTHRKSTLEGKPGVRERALSTRRSGGQKRRWQSKCVKMGFSDSKVHWVLLRRDSNFHLQLKYILISNNCDDSLNTNI